MHQPQNEHKVIHVFDLDDTLIKSIARIKVTYKPTGKQMSYTPEEYNMLSEHYKQDPDYEISFDEFMDYDILYQSMELILFNVFQGLYFAHQPVAILTSREITQYLLSWLRTKYGMNLSEDYVFCINDRSDKYNYSDAELKAMKIRELIERDYDTVIVYDDNAQFAAAMRAVESEYPGSRVIAITDFHNAYR